MQRGGEGFPVRPQMVVAGITVLVVAYLGLPLLAKNTEDKLTSDLPDQPIDVLIPLHQRLSQTNDPNQLLNLGQKLLESNTSELAIPVLERAAEVAPSSRDIQLLLAWSYLKVNDLSKAQTAIGQARRLDPIDAQVTELATIIRSYQTKEGE